MSDQITHCLTIGRRPALLAQTLASLPPEIAALPTLAVNDFGDAETSAVFRAAMPVGRIVGPGHHLGHHGAVDAMYTEVTTPFVLHGEDDWAFTRGGVLAPALQLLRDPAISVVCLRDLDDIPLPEADRARIVTETRDGIRFARLDGLHPQWHGFTFNPHLARLSLWQGLGGFSSFAKERHISRHLRAKGQYVAFLCPGACHHIGEDASVAHPPPGAFKRFKTWLRGRR